MAFKNDSSCIYSAVKRFLPLPGFSFFCIFVTLSDHQTNFNITRAVTVADFYHRGGNGPTTADGTVLCIFIYIILKCKNK